VKRLDVVEQVIHLVEPLVDDPGKPRKRQFKGIHGVMRGTGAVVRVGRAPNDGKQRFRRHTRGPLTFPHTHWLHFLTDRAFS
jgi:hypothetical protein